MKNSRTYLQVLSENHMSRALCWKIRR